MSAIPNKRRGDALSEGDARVKRARCEHCMSLVEDEDIASQANGDVDDTSIEVEREGIIAAPAPLPEVPPQPVANNGGDYAALDIILATADITVAARLKQNKYALGRCWCCGNPTQVCGRPLFCRAKYAPAHYLVDNNGARTWVPRNEDRPPACRTFNTGMCVAGCTAELHWCSLCESYEHGAQDCDRDFLHLGHGLFRTRSVAEAIAKPAGTGGGGRRRGRGARRDLPPPY